MTMTVRMPGWGVFLCLGLATAVVHAQDTRHGGGDASKTAPTAEEPIIEAPPEEAPKSLPGPTYLNLRYDEDFSYLDGDPGMYREDIFDPIKNIRLGDDLRLTIGGDFRFRFESETNKAFGSNARTQDSFQLYREHLHFDLKYRDTARVFLQLSAGQVGDRDLAARVGDENRFALHQLFVDFKPAGDGTPLTVRIGRQELQYGAQRFMSPLDWANVRRRFDAVKVFWHDEKWKFDVFYAKPVVVRPAHPDPWDEEVDVYGAYFTYLGIPNHGVDLFFFGQDDTRDRRNPNGRVGDMSRYTLGSRFWGKRGPFDYDAFVAGQWGTWAGDTIQGWAWGGHAGYTFIDTPWRPRIAAGFDWASGDENPTDGKVGTFDQLFPLGHAYFGYLDLIGRQNITAVNVNLSAWPVAKKVEAAIGYHTFWLNANEDALYNAGGVAGRRDPTGQSGTEVGHEVDLTILWKIDVHQSLLLGYSHLWDSDFIINTGSSEDPDLFYVRYDFKF